METFLTFLSLQTQSSPMLPQLIISERSQPRKKSDLDGRAHLPTI
ncbi:hypothetical protein KGM_204040 [Danaus plexippus plexippus]|uniref:Uncharacterized protein n=1 Tax=Danaus plexippus plexippus TaxID=278856 RepID=A0A212FQ26_DANPL|nr:hypothetical protein KGM_204040 [Danaus plexippus plexippus]